MIGINELSKDDVDKIIKSIVSLEAEKLYRKDIETFGNNSDKLKDSNEYWINAEKYVLEKIQ